MERLKSPLNALRANNPSPSAAQFPGRQASSVAHTRRKIDYWQASRIISRRSPARHFRSTAEQSGPLQRAIILFCVLICARAGRATGDFPPIFPLTRDLQLIFQTRDYLPPSNYAPGHVFAENYGGEFPEKVGMERQERLGGQFASENAPTENLESLFALFRELSTVAYGCNGQRTSAANLSGCSRAAQKRAPKIKCGPIFRAL